MVTQGGFGEQVNKSAELAVLTEAMWAKGAPVEILASWEQKNDKKRQIGKL